MKTVVMDHVMDAGFELQYKVAAEFKCNLFSSCLQATALYQLCDGIWVLGSLRQHVQEN